MKSEPDKGLGVVKEVKNLRGFKTPQWKPSDEATKESDALAMENPVKKLVKPKTVKPDAINISSLINLSRLGDLLNNIVADNMNLKAQIGVIFDHFEQVDMNLTSACTNIHRIDRRTRD